MNSGVVNNSSIVDYIKRRLQILEEKNDIMNFAELNCEIEEDKANRTNFFRLKRKFILKTARVGSELDDDFSRKGPRTVPNALLRQNEKFNVKKFVSESCGRTRRQGTVLETKKVLFVHASETPNHYVSHCFCFL